MNLKLAISLSVALALALPGAALAHVANERTRYSDIADSDAKLDIMLVSSLGILPEVPAFEPEAPLTKAELAAWVASLEGLVEGHGHETADVADLAKAAFDAGKVESIEGAADFADVAAAFFAGQVQAPADGRAPTKAEAVQFIVANLKTPINGKTLLESKGFAEGPVGVVTDLKSETTTSGGTAYTMTIGDLTAIAHAHIKVANGQTDLKTWAGRTVQRTLIREIDGKTYWTYLEADAPDANASAEEAHRH